MPQYTTTLGDGLSDTGASFILSVGSGTDLMSDWNPTDTYQNGAFESNGTTANTTQIALITSLRLRFGGTAGGYASTADGQIELASTNSGTNIYSSPTAVNTTGTTATYTANVGSGWKIIPTTTYYYGFDAATGTGTTLVFARGSDGAGSTWRDGSLDFDSRISGEVVHRSIPSAPGTPTATNISASTLTLNWTIPSDDGIQASGSSAANIKGYRINYKKNSESAWQVLVGNTGSNTTSYSVTGLEPNTSYNFQVAALNQVTDAWSDGVYSSITSPVGVRSSTLTVSTLGGIFNVYVGGGNFSDGIVKVWNGSTFANAVTKVYNPGHPNADGNGFVVST